MVRLSAAIQTNDRGSGLKTVLPDRFSGLQKKIFWRLFFENAPFKPKIRGVVLVYHLDNSSPVFDTKTL
jgi:hypothetical protein